MEIDLERLKLPALRKLASDVAAEIMLRENATSSGNNRYANAHFWYEALKSVMSAEGPGMMMPAAVFSRSGNSATFQKALPAADQLVEKFRAPKERVLRQPQEMKIREVVINTLITSMKRKKVPVSLGSVCRNMQNASAAINEEYPGYMKSGLLHLILK